MRDRLWFMALVALLAPTSSEALQLHWSNGTDTLSFAQTSRCVLVLQADQGEPSLPAEWRLLWVADSAGVRGAAMDSATYCGADSALVFALSPAATSDDSASRVVTAHFCSAGGAAARTAYYILDQSGGSAGRLKVIALDPRIPIRAEFLNRIRSRTMEVSMGSTSRSFCTLPAFINLSSCASRQWALDLTRQAPWESRRLILLGALTSTSYRRPTDP